MTTLLILLLFIWSCCSFDLRIKRIGIDYGPKLIGTSYSNKLGMVLPDKTLAHTGNLEYLAERISGIVAEKQAEEVIVGVPLGDKDELHGCVSNYNGKLCIQFSSVLAFVLAKSSQSCKVWLIDESYSTKEAISRLVHRATAGLIILRFIK